MGAPWGTAPHSASSAVDERGCTSSLTANGQGQAAKGKVRRTSTHEVLARRAGASHRIYGRVERHQDEGRPELGQPVEGSH